MASKAALSEEQYLRTSYPGVDPEFRDGELVERAMPDFYHSDVQSIVNAWFRRRWKSHHLHGFTEMRLRPRPGRMLIPDVSVFWPEKPPGGAPDSRPLIAIEILSPDDRFSDARTKLEEYAAWGVPHVWLIDPRKKLLYVYAGGLHEVPELKLPEVALTLTPRDLFEDSE